MWYNISIWNVVISRDIALLLSSLKGDFIMELKEIADTVIGDNNSDSVVKYIEQCENATNL